MEKVADALSDVKTQLPLPSTSSPRAPDAPRRRNGFYALGALALIGYLASQHCNTASDGQQQHHGADGRGRSGNFTRPDVPAIRSGAYTAAGDGARNPAYLVEATHGAVATENVVCSDTGVSVLKDGGNAVDAAIAACLCIGTQNMFSSGIGGGGFMTVRVPTPDGASEVFTIDFRETAPSRAWKDMYVGRPEAARYGGLSVGVPGELRGLQEAHQRWGKLPWKRLVEPAAALAHASPVGKELGKRLPWFEEYILSMPEWSALYAPNGTLLKEGEVLRQTNLSRTLYTIASEGADAFYSGPIAESLVARIQHTGGIMALEDLANYTPKINKALEGSYRGYKIHTTHAPTSGPVLLHMFNLAERLDIANVDDVGLQTHFRVECMKYGFAARTRVCDPAFNDDPRRINIIPTAKFADAIYVNISKDSTHDASYYNPIYDVPMDHGTMHISTYSKDGFAVSLTSTVNLIFGSLLIDPATGVLLNDEMDDFSIPGVPNAFGLWPSPYNFPAPHKRPLSSTVPTIIEDDAGEFKLALGGAGGSRIFGAVFQTILNALDGELDISAAIEHGRVHDQLFPPIVDVDDGLGREVVDALVQRWHNVTVSDMYGVKAVVNGVMRIGDSIFAASDSRKNGIAAGW